MRTSVTKKADSAAPRRAKPTPIPTGQREEAMVPRTLDRPSLEFGDDLLRGERRVDGRVELGYTFDVRSDPVNNSATSSEMALRP